MKIRSSRASKRAPTVPDHQVGAHFEAMNEEVLVAALKLSGYFFSFQFSQRCGAMNPLVPGLSMIRLLLCRIFSTIVTTI